MLESAVPWPRARTQLRDEAAAHVRELIVTGQARPGTLVRLGRLATEMDMSATPVREALILLAQDGWVAQEPNRGFRVLPLQRQDVVDTYLVHAYVAGELASRAALSVHDRALARLRALDAQIDALGADSEFHRLEALNQQLHWEIYQLAASPRLLWFARSASRFIPRRHWAIIPGWVELNRTGHAPIIAALAAADAEHARAHMQSHILDAGELLLAHLDAASFWSD